MNAILPPAAVTGTLISGKNSPISLSPEPLKRTLNSKAQLMSAQGSRSKIKFMQNLVDGRSPSKSPTPRPKRPESQLRGSIDAQKRMGS